MTAGPGPRVVGLTLTLGLEEGALAAARRAEDTALANLPWLRNAACDAGAARLRVWGHGDVASCVRRLPGGALAVVAGEPLPTPTPEELELLGDEAGSVPWEGRLLAVHVDAAGTGWRVRNDWSGAIPAFHAAAGDGRIVSTLEPAVVSACGAGPADLSRAGVVSLLVHGYFGGTKTLYEDISALRADSELVWDPAGVTLRDQGTVVASGERLHAGWDALAEEMAALTSAAMQRRLRSSPRWSIALSGGLDSRLIAAEARAVGVEMEAFTYGDPGWPDLHYAKRVARMLGMPWTGVDLGSEYLVRHSRAWADWFGASMHMHGMYQVPLLERVGPSGGPLAMGYTGDPMGGAQTTTLMGAAGSFRRRLATKWHMWEEHELAGLLRFDPADAVEQLDADFAALEREVDGLEHQRAWLLFQRTQMARFSSYQPVMHDLWCGAGAPFVDRSLARFALSLPRAVLDGRRLQLAAFRLAHPKLATIPGTFGYEPAAPSGRHYLKRTLADVLPEPLLRGPLRVMAPWPNDADQRNLRAGGVAAVWPLAETREALGDWLDLAVLDRTVERARGGDLGALARVQAVQALALALAR